MPAPSAAVTRIRTWVASATTKSTNHYTITAIELETLGLKDFQNELILHKIALKDR